jgi:hypothetical protein
MEKCASGAIDAAKPSFTGQHRGRRGRGGAQPAITPTSAAARRISVTDRRSSCAHPLEMPTIAESASI